LSKRALIRALIGACAAVSALAIPVASASASNLWVSSSAPVSSPDNSCAHPGYSKIQTAIAAASTGATVQVCAGSYTEQLTIKKVVKLNAANGAGTATVVLPVSPAVSTTECDEASLRGLKKLEVEEGNPESDAQPDEDAVSICTSGTVTITGLTFEPKWPEGTCYDSLYGILVGDGGTLKATNVTVDGGGAFPINGCQGGVSIQVGMAWALPVEPANAKLTEDTVTEYQKNGITVDGQGSSAKISETTVIGAGETTQTAQNGIQISNGAQGTVVSSNISGNECNNANCSSNAFEGAQATGVLFYGAASGSKVTSSTLKKNDVGAYFVSQSATQPHSPEVTITKDVFDNDRYEGVDLDQGDASLKDDAITGPGEIGIDLFQYEGQAYAPTSSASSDEVEGMTDAAIKVQSDKASGDHSGSFKITNSALSNNAQVLEDESSTFTVVL
jgi:hypothetical protein